MVGTPLRPRMRFFLACSAGEAGVPGWRPPLAVHALCRELPPGNIEDVGQPVNLIGGEPALPAVAVAFGGAHSGVGAPAHQLTELRLRPPLAMTQGADVRADDGALASRDLIDAAAPPGRHAPTFCQVTW